MENIPIVSVLSVVIGFGVVLIVLSYLINYTIVCRVNKYYDAKIAEKPERSDLINTIRYVDLGEEKLAEGFFHLYLEAKIEEALVELKQTKTT